MNDKDSELIDDVKNELNDDNEEIILFLCFSNVLTKESLKNLKSFCKKKNKSKKMKILIKTVNDILLTEKENSESLSFVDNYELTLDSPNNYLKFTENEDLKGIVINVETKSINELYDKHYQRGLLGANIRYFVKNKQIDDKIKNTLLNEGELFWFKNNGILIIAESYEIREKRIIIKKFSIVNGGQTTYLLGNANINPNAFVMCKIIIPQTQARNEKIISDIAEATNSQKPIKQQDIIANYPFVRELKDNLLHTSKHKIMLEIKRGEKRDKMIFPKNFNYIKSSVFAGLIVSTLQVNPGKARNSVAKLFSSEEAIKAIFKPDIKQNFYQDLIYMWNMYEDYMKFIAKKNNLSKIVIQNNRNMKFYTLTSAYIFYLLSTNSEILNKAQYILKNSPTPINNMMNLLECVDVNNFKSMLKNYGRQDIYVLFGMIHKILNSKFEIIREVYKQTQKPFDMASLARTQKVFGEQFIIPLVQSFIEDDQLNVKSYTFTIFENK